MRSQLQLCGTAKREDDMPFGAKFMASELAKIYIGLVVNDNK
jgi:hypothetical protein